MYYVSRNNHFDRRIWKFGRDDSRPFPAHWTSGLMLPRRTIRSRAYLPGIAERRELGSNKIPFWIPLNYTLQAQASQAGAISTDWNFTALALMASSSQAKGFQSQFYQIATPQGGGCRMMRVGIRQPNLAGTAQQPFFLKRPYHIPNRLALKNMSTNLALSTDPNNGTNSVQIVWYGVRDLDSAGKS